MKNIIFLFLIMFVTLYSQQSEQKNLGDKANISVMGGFLLGDPRFYPTLNVSLSCGYYLTNNNTFSLNYSPVYLKSNNAREPFFFVNGDTLKKNETTIFNELHLLLSHNIYHNIWFSWGVAPFDKISFLFGIEYKSALSPKIDIVLKNQFLTIGRYFFDDNQNSFATYRFSIGIEFRP